MKSKYKTYFKKSFKEYNIEMRRSRSEYVFMYCKKTINDFDKKAKRIKNRSLLRLIKTIGRLYLRNNFI